MKDLTDVMDLLGNLRDFLDELPVSDETTEFIEKIADAIDVLDIALDSDEHQSSDYDNDEDEEEESDELW